MDIVVSALCCCYPCLFSCNNVVLINYVYSELGFSYYIEFINLFVLLLNTTAALCIELVLFLTAKLLLVEVVTCVEMSYATGTSHYPTSRLIS